MPRKPGIPPIPPCLEGHVASVRVMVPRKRIGTSSPWRWPNRGTTTVPPSRNPEVKCLWLVGSLKKYLGEACSSLASKWFFFASSTEVLLKISSTNNSCSTANGKHKQQSRGSHSMIVESKLQLFWWNLNKLKSLLCSGAIACPSLQI